MMLLLIWAAVGFLMGLLCVIFIPWSAARLAGGGWQEAVASKYVWLAQTAASHAAINARPGNLELVAKSWDSEVKADKDSSQGDPRHHRDDLGTLSRLANKPFGFVLESHNEYVSPLLAELGRKARDLRDDGDLGPTRIEGQELMRDGIRTQSTSRLVNITDASYVLSGDSAPEDGHESYIQTKISQEKFNERVSFGQVLVMVLSMLGSMVTMWYITDSGASGAVDSGTTVSMLLFLGPAIGGVRERVRGVREWFGRINWAAIGAVGYAAAMVMSVPVIAGLTYGLIAALIAGGIMLFVAVGFPLTIALLGPGIPQFLGIGLARGFWILAQLSVGRGVLVERATGEYEYHRLRDAGPRYSTEFVTTLSDGTELPVDGSRGDLFRFGWAPIGITAEKTDANMGRISETPPESMRADGGSEVLSNQTRQGYRSLLPLPEDREWLVTLPQLWTWCRKSAESEAVEKGRDKALTEHGGEQQLGGLGLMAMTLAGIVVGGAMGYFAAGGGI